MEKAKVFGSLGGITRLATQVSLSESLGTDDVKIYCDQNRIERVSEEGRKFWFDNQIKNELASEDYSSCGLNTFMYTTHPTAKNIYMQIQICPHFLNWALPSPEKWTVFLMADYWKKVGESFVEKLAYLKYTPIDVYSLFDKVVLHELTHASRVFRTVDVNNGDGLAYGWKKCRALSTV
ncbi:hypothetical protein WAI453_003016 [Rhynchosporium graminicola]